MEKIKNGGQQERIGGVGAQEWIIDVPYPSYFVDLSSTGFHIFGH